MANVKSYVAKKSHSGFTIIELLSSMVVLIFIVMMMTRMFAETTNIWSLGTKRITAASEGRVIMDFIVKEMTQAIADDIVAFKLNSGGENSDPIYGVDAYGAESDEVCFVGAVRSCDPGYRRTGNQFIYFLSPMLDENSNEIPNRYRLVRTRRTQSMYATVANRSVSAYRDKEWWRNMPADKTEAGGAGTLPVETIAENVAAFEVWAYSEKKKDFEFGYNSVDEDNMLPLWVDIYLELMSEDEAQRAAILWQADTTRASEYLATVVKRFNARVYFPNRERALAFKQ